MQWGGDGRLYAGKVELVTEENPRWSARLVYAEVNPENQRINKAATLKGVQLAWSGDVTSTVRLSTSVRYTDASHSDDLGASMGINYHLVLVCRRRRRFSPPRRASSQCKAGQRQRQGDDQQHPQQGINRVNAVVL